MQHLCTKFKQILGSRSLVKKDDFRNNVLLRSKRALLPILESDFGPKESSFSDQAKAFVNKLFETLLQLVSRFRPKQSENCYGLSSLMNPECIFRGLLENSAKTAENFIRKVQNVVNEFLDRFVGSEPQGVALYRALPLQTAFCSILSGSCPWLNATLKTLLAKVIGNLDNATFKFYSSQLELVRMFLNGLIDRVFLVQEVQPLRF